jgi:hypothetical protein
MESSATRSRSISLRRPVDDTPSFLINGKLFAGARPTEQFRASIDPELAKTP